MATASTVAFGGLALSGTDFRNYNLTQQSPANATITALSPVLPTSSIPIAAPLISIALTMNPPLPASTYVEAALPPALMEPIGVNSSDSATMAPDASPIAIGDDTSVPGSSESAASTQGTQFGLSAGPVLPAALQLLSPFTTLTILGGGIEFLDKPVAAKK